MIYVVIGLMALMALIKIFDVYFCWDCKKFTLRTKVFGPAFMAVPSPVPQQPDMIYEVWRPVRECTCCHKARMLAMIPQLTTQEKADAYYASLRKPRTTASDAS